MKTGIRINERKFYVNKEKKVVACVIETCVNLKAPLDAIPFDALHKHGVDNTYNFIAVAKCSPLDSFDEEKGKRIAESRAKAKAFKFWGNAFDRVSIELTDKALQASCIARGCEYARDTELKHISKLDNDCKC